MSEFWMWFIRPIAEMLGALFLVGCILAVVGIGIVANAYYNLWIAKKKKEQANERDA